MREQLGDGVHRTPIREGETARGKRQILRRSAPAPRRTRHRRSATRSRDRPGFAPRAPTGCLPSTRLRAETQPPDRLPARRRRGRPAMEGRIATPRTGASRRRFRSRRGVRSRDGSSRDHRSHRSVQRACSEGPPAVDAINTISSPLERSTARPSSMTAKRSATSSTTPPRLTPVHRCKIAAPRFSSARATSASRRRQFFRIE